MNILVNSDGYNGISNEVSNSDDLTSKIMYMEFCFSAMTYYQKVNFGFFKHLI